MAHKKRRKLSKQGKIIIGGSIGLIVLLVSSIFLFKPQAKINQEVIATPIATVTPTIDPIELKKQELADKYNPIWDEFSALNEDYIAYLEWDNNLLYDYGDDTTDPYPHLIVRSRIVDAGEGNVNAANSEYMRNDISHAPRSFGQDFMDGESGVDENYVPTDQNLIIYGHYVYPFKYETDKLKFTPLHKLKDPSVYDMYDTFTLTFNDQQRTYQVAHVFLFNKASFTTREDSPLALNYTPEQLENYMNKIDTVYGDFLDTGIEIGPNDHFATLQTCVENREDQLLFVVAKEIDRVDF